MEMGLEQGNSIVMTQHYMFIAEARDSKTVRVHISRAAGGFTDFRKARMPVQYKLTDYFTIMDTNEKTVFLFLSDFTLANPVGNLFISDGIGSRFTHSLENVVKSAWSTNALVDFEAIESLDGTFIANRYDFVHEWEGSMDSKERHKKLREITDQDIDKGMQKMESKLSKESKRAGVHNAEAGRMQEMTKDG